MCITLAPYSNEHKTEWNSIVQRADNGHFMFNRNYMDYHSDRFIDASFVVFKKNQMIGVIPGNKDQKIWHSHQGLTFGGVLLTPKHNRIHDYCSIYEALLDNLKQQEYTHCHIKIIPHIYHRNPCENELYVMQHHAQKIYFEPSTAIDLRETPNVSQIRIRNYKKAKNNKLIVKEENDLSPFWSLLCARLKQKYNKNPVHALSEIQVLKNKFPNNIKLFTTSCPLSGLCAGSVIYETDATAHAQYIAANDIGLEKGALDLLFFTLFDKYREEAKRFFDFGISTENKGASLNHSLIQFKEGFGGRTILHHQLVASL